MSEQNAGLGGLDRSDCFALVVYIPGPLAIFLDGLRRDLEPAAISPRAHVTILPPRPLAGASQRIDAVERIERQLTAADAFRISCGRIEIFPGTNVVYLSVDAGFPELVLMHSRLAEGALEFCEPHIYHPHVTLAQGMASLNSAKSAAAEADRRWREFREERGFLVETLTFVQRTEDQTWTDLASYRLNQTPVML